MVFFAEGDTKDGSFTNLHGSLQAELFSKTMPLHLQSFVKLDIHMGEKKSRKKNSNREALSIESDNTSLHRTLG